MGSLSKQQILDYEVSMIQYQANGLSKPFIMTNSKYGIWELEQKIKKTIHDQQYTVRWIGNSQTAYLQAYVYVLLSMCTHSDDLILSVKNGLYQLGQKYLQKHNQKLLVQFLCLIQYTRDKFLFLRKYPQVQQLIVSILKFIQSQNQIQVQRSNDSPTKDRKSVYDKFHKIFQFIEVFHPNQYTYIFLVSGSKINVIVQKECYFVIESQKNHNNRQIKTIFKSRSKNQILTFKKSNDKNQKAKSNQNNKNRIYKEEIRIKSNFQSPRKLQNQKAFVSKSNYKPKKRLNQSIQNSIQEFDNEPSIITHLQRQERICPKLQESFEQRQYVNYQNNFEQFQTKKGRVEKDFLRKFQKCKQQNIQHWHRVELDYYQRKRKIIQNSKNLIHLKKLAASKQQQSEKKQKQRKTSFNSYTGISILQRIKQKNKTENSNKQKTKSTIESTPSLAQSKKKTKQRKGSLKTQSVPFYFHQLKKNNNFKLSVIQEQNRAKFLSKKQKTKKRQPQQSAPRQISHYLTCPSNRQTINSNKQVTFRYINKEDFEKAIKIGQSRKIEI